MNIIVWTIDSCMSEHSILSGRTSPSRSCVVVCIELNTRYRCVHNHWFWSSWWELIWILLFNVAPKGVFHIFQLHSAKWTQAMLGKVIMWEMNIINPAHSACAVWTEADITPYRERTKWPLKTETFSQESSTLQTFPQDQHCSLPRGPMPVNQLKRLQRERPV